MPHRVHDKHCWLVFKSRRVFSLCWFHHGSSFWSSANLKCGLFNGALELSPLYTALSWAFCSSIVPRWTSAGHNRGWKLFHPNQQGRKTVQGWDTVIIHKHDFYRLLLAISILAIIQRNTKKIRHWRRFQARHFCGAPSWIHLSLIKPWCPEWVTDMAVIGLKPGPQEE